MKQSNKKGVKTHTSVTGVRFVHVRTMIDDPARPSGTKLFYSRPMLIKKRKKVW